MNEKLLIPISIVIAAVLIGGAILFTNSQEPVVVTQPNTQPQSQEEPDIRAVSDSNDRIIGSADAELFVVEYSDIDCPFCKRYHDQVLNRLVQEYGDNDRIAFVFRHFPLDEPFTNPIHPAATESAVASECVASLAGDESFFTFLDKLFADEETGSLSDTALLVKLSQYAVESGAEKVAFENCYATFDTTKVEADFNDGRDGGVQGTPTVFVQTNSGENYLASPDYNVLKQAIDVFLGEN